jgi:predicted phosphate transport protein (TIGR00153 family)
MALLKKDMNYFDMFVKGVQYSLDAAILLKDLLDNDSLSEEKIQQIKKIEQEADVHSHEVFKQLNVAFITPIDREDIYSIIKETDDITDSIEAVSNKMWMMSVNEITPAMKLMGQYIVNACRSLVNLMSEIKNHKKSNKLNDYAIEINNIEEQGDRCYKDAMKELFDKEKDPVRIIKMKEIYKELEDTLDNCEDVADCVEGIIITKT